MKNLTENLNVWIIEKQEMQSYINNNLLKVVDGVTSAKLRKFSDEALGIVNQIAFNSILGRPDSDSIKFLELCLDNLFYAYIENEKFKLQYSFKRVVMGAVNQVLTQVMKNAATSLMLYQKI